MECELHLGYNTWSIAVTSPNGGEGWPVGSIHNITWTSTGNSGTVQYRIFNQQWYKLDSALSQVHRMMVHIHGLFLMHYQQHCLVRVSDTDGSPVDVSNAVFSIISCSGGGCINETFTAATGTVTDNSGASNYLNNMSCEKLIQPSEAEPLPLHSLHSIQKPGMILSGYITDLQHLLLCWVVTAVLLCLRF